MSLRGPVLAAIDLTEAAGETLRQASAIAAGLEARLIVCHILPEALRVRMLFPQLAVPDPGTQATFEERAREAVEVQVMAATGRAKGSVDVRLDSGSTHGGILAQADREDAGLVVIGPGTVALRVARYAKCPVLLARPSPPGCVLGTTDFSDPSLPAVEAAVVEAQRRGVDLRLMHGLEIDDLVLIGSPAVGVLPPLPAHIIEECQEDARRRLRASLATFGASGECLVPRGRPSVSIVAAASEVATQLVVVGTHGRTGVAHALLGSVAEAVLHTAPCSVLVVRLMP